MINIFTCQVCGQSYLSSQEALECENQTIEKPSFWINRKYRSQITNRIGKIIGFKLVAEEPLKHAWVILFDTRIFTDPTPFLHPNCDLELIDTQLSKVY
jgi:hypothetical protein